jgi:hypothetical protein
VTSENLTLEHARYYLSRGFHPIPLKHGTKKPPIVPGGWDRYKTQAPTDAELVAWFGGQPRNIALVTGRGIMAVDLDGPGAEQLLEREGIRLPEDAPRQKTKDDSFHVFLRVNGPVGNRVALLETPERKPGNSKKALAQVDIRGDGGYIVAAPSIHPDTGMAYEWLQRPDTLPDAPEALLSLLAAPPVPAGAAAAVPEGQQPKWVAEALKGVGEGKRDQTCARLAGYFIKKKMGHDIVMAVLTSWADRCSPPFPHDEVLKTVDSILKKDAAAPPPGPEDATVVHPEPFQILGYNQGSYFYLPVGSQQIVELRAEQHSKLNLLRLAPFAYWERAYVGQSGPRWELAANALIRKAEAAGVYDTSRIRGRGAWWDSERAVLHLGDRVIVDDRSYSIFEAPSKRYIYEAAPPMPIELDSPLDVAEANVVAQICDLISWERPISARLLAGWIAVAPICGAVDWRPHVWITGQAGSGKSWVIDKIVRRLLGDMGLAVQSETTEAGLRQTLGHDARPIVFDEIEGEDLRAQQRIQNVLALARQASSETGAVIIKGSPLGIAKTYRIRSCFAFSSIGVGLEAHADQTRVAVLTIRPDGSADRFSRLASLTADTLSDLYVRRFLARSVRMAPVIRANARVFAAAGAAVIGSQRLGDQVGALLAGAYSLFNDGPITAQDAQAWVAKQDWSEQKDLTASADEARCLQRILERVVRVQDKYGVFERSVAELILVAACKREDTVTMDAAISHLLRLGIRVDRGDDLDVFLISSTHDAISRMLEGTPWVRNWGRLLRRLPAAEATAPTRFAGVRARAVSIPLSVLEQGNTTQADPLEFPPRESQEAML